MAIAGSGPGYLIGLDQIERADAVPLGCNSVDPMVIDSVIVVLGVKLKNGKPTPHLYRRVCAAENVFRLFPQSLLVVSGAASEADETSEAAAMERLLLKAGVPAERIVQESKATNTRQNIRYSLDLAASLCDVKSSSIVICTERYHSVRARLIAWMLGFKTTSVRLPGLPDDSSWVFRGRLFFYELVASAKDCVVIFSHEFTRRLRKVFQL